jgi:tetratricopeptide (TPR) repeat protein
VSAPLFALRGLVVVGALALAACPGGTGKEAAPARDPARERIVEFWRRYNAATAARIERDFATASNRYEEALVLDPGHEECLYYLGQSRRELGQTEKARAAFERLLETNPLSARGHLALGALLSSPDPGEPMDLPAAEGHFRRAHEINGEETGPMVRLGEVLIAAGRVEEARTWLESALRTNPKSVEAAFLAGYVVWEEGTRDTAPALLRLREAAKLEAPVKGVLSEGDRRDGRRVAAPPLESPLGKLLFGDPVLSLRSRAAAGEPLTNASVIEAWRAVRRSRREYEQRATTR